MAEPHWMSYVGMITGIIGAFTGVTGSIMGYVGYRRSNKLKSLDLRLELRKAVGAASVALQQLRDLIHSADKSRINSLAARGLGSSGVLVTWKLQVQDDNAKIGKLTQQIPSDGTDYNKLGPDQLESGLIAIHKCQKEIDVLRDKYCSTIQSDKDFHNSRNR